MHNIRICKKTNTVYKQFVSRIGSKAALEKRNINLFNNEVKCLQDLQERFINNPEIKHYPFPKIISIDQQHHIIKMSYCGDTINNTNVQPNNIINTIECIINNLKNIPMIYTQMNSQHICINQVGNIHLIDFDECIIDRTIKLTKWARLNEIYNKPVDIKKIGINKKLPWSMLNILQK